MKHSLLFLFSTFFYSGIFAQFKSPVNQVPEYHRTFFGKNDSYSDSARMYQWNPGTQQWDFTYSQFFFRNGQGDLDSSLWKTASGSFYMAYAFKHNSSGKETEVKSYAWHNSQWIPDHLSITNYNASGHRTSYLTYGFNSNSGQFENPEGDSIVYTYGTNNRVEAYVLHQVSMGSVDEAQRLTWSDFDNNNLPGTLEVEVNQFGQYSPFVRMENLKWGIGFDLLNFDPTGYYGFSWDGNAWDPQAYDSTVVQNGRKSERITSDWNGLNSSPSSRITYHYDAAEHLATTRNYQYIAGQWGLVYSELDSIHYGAFDEIRENITGFSQGQGAWIFQEKIVYYYNGLSINPTVSQEASVYPNPGRGLVRINLDERVSEVKAYDIQGREMPLALNENNEFSTTAWPDGIYILNIRSGQQFFHAKILVKN